MKPIVKHTILLAILAAVYFAAEFLEKGQILNSITPFPILGTAFWLILIYVVYVVAIQPIMQFRRLKNRKEEAIPIDSQAREIRDSLAKFKNERRETCWQSEIWYKLDQILQKKLEGHDNAQREQELSQIISLYHQKADSESPKNAKAKEIIRNYSWSGALLVVFSRNSFIDGLMMLFTQMKMTVELARIYGYTPSPLFNSLCFGWIATNSIATGLLAQSGADTVGEIIADTLTDCEQLGNSLGNTILSKTSSLAMEALTTATTIFVTGEIVHLKLKGMPAIDIRQLFQMRRATRFELMKEIPESVTKKLSPTVSSIFQKMKDYLATAMAAKNPSIEE